MKLKRESIFDISLIATIYIMLKPIYLSSSGTMQICDFFFIAALVFIILKFRGKLVCLDGSYRVIKPLFMLIVYQIIINVLWYLVTSEPDLLRRTTYYIFNFLVFFMSFLIAGEVGTQKLKKAMANGIFLAMIITGFGLVFAGNSGTRSSGFFNNPNQLGYFGLLVITFIAFFPDLFSKIKRIIVVVLALWAIVKSSSKAAFFSIIVLAVLIILFAQKERKIGTIIKQLFLLLIIGIAIYVFFFSNNSFITSNSVLMFLRKRIINASADPDNAMGTGRGYDRIYEMGIHWLWGVGEGAYGRFTTMKGVEANTTYATIFVSYGVIGFGGYIYTFSRMINNGKTTLKNLVCFSGVLIYFISHNALRNTFLWMILSVITMDTLYSHSNDKKSLCLDL